MSDPSLVQALCVNTQGETIRGTFALGCWLREVYTAEETASILRNLTVKLPAAKTPQFELVFNNLYGLLEIKLVDENTSFLVDLNMRKREDAKLLESANQQLRLI